MRGRQRTLLQRVSTGAKDAQHEWTGTQLANLVPNYPVRHMGSSR